MAGRSRTTVSSSPLEDFQPHVERKEEQGANILTIHLPGFRNDQIKVTYVSTSGNIKVQAERVIAKNRRSRFEQSFPVPQNCTTEKIQGTFRNGILTITMPKQSITDQVGSVKDANATKEITPPKATSQQKPMKDQKKPTPPKAASTTTTSGAKKQKDDKIQPPQTPQKAITDDQPEASMVERGPQQIAPPKVEALQPPKLQEEAQKKAAAIAPTIEQAEEKSAGSTSTAEIPPPQTPQKAMTDDQPKASTVEMGPQQNAPPKVGTLQPSKLQEETQKKAAAAIATTSKQAEEKTVGSTSTAEIVEKKDESKVGFNDQIKEKESGKSEEDSTMHETNLPKIPAKGKKDDKAVDGGAAVEEKPREGASSSFLEKAKEMKGMDTIIKTIKKLTPDDYEDRQLLINIGVSVLVIVAVGAYITYRYRSFGKAKD